jgi:hypothetical protein
LINRYENSADTTSSASGTANGILKVSGDTAGISLEGGVSWVLVSGGLASKGTCSAGVAGITSGTGSIIGSETVGAIYSGSGGTTAAGITSGSGAITTAGITSGSCTAI